MKNYSPILTTDKILCEILEVLERIEATLGNQEKPVAEEKKPVAAQAAKPVKVCKYCGKVHDRFVDYAVCANKHKK